MTTATQYLLGIAMSASRHVRGSRTGLCVGFPTRSTGDVFGESTGGTADRRAISAVHIEVRSTNDE